MSIKEECLSNSKRNMKPVFAIQIRREINLKQPWLTLWEWKKISWNLWKSSSTSLKKS